MNSLCSGCAMVLIWLCFPCNVTATSRRCATGQTESLQTAIYSVRINGHPASAFNPAGTLFLHNSDDLYIRMQDANLLRLDFVEAAICIEEGEQFVALLDIHGMSYSLDSGNQEVLLTPTARAFRRVEVNEAIGQDNDPAVGSTGAFFNYDVGVERSPKTTRANGLFEVGHFNRLGLLTSTFLARDLSQKGLVRLETAFTYDLPNRRQSIRFGDSVTRIGQWGRALYIGGIQWGSDFSLQPEFIQFPQPSILGEAVAPSTADLYVNAALRWSQAVQPGPFEIRNAPVVSGPGEIKLVVRDMLGRETVSARSYFVSTKLLRPGVSDFSVAVGKVRNNLGLTNWKYTHAIATGYYRRGVTNRITAEVEGEKSKHISNAGTRLTAHIAGPLLGSVGIVGSDGLRARGQMLTGGFDFQTRFLSMGAHAQQTRGSFQQAGTSRFDHWPTRQHSGYLGFTTFGRDHFTISTFRQDARPAIRYTSGVYTVPVRRNLYWSTTYTRSSAGIRQSVATTSLTLQLAEQTILSAGTVREQHDYREQLTLQRNRPIGPGIGYRVTSEGGQQRRLEAEAVIARESAEYTALFNRTKAGSAARAGVRGALGWMGRRLFRTRRIDDAFAVVKVGAYENVPILADNQPVANTDGSGVAIVPRLLSYQRNRISIDATALPVDVAVNQVDIQLKPKRRSGVTINFPTSEETGLALRLIMDGAPVLQGAAVTVDDIPVPSRVGADGVVYLPHVVKDTFTLRANWPNGSCAAVIVIPARVRRNITELEVTCAR